MATTKQKAAMMERRFDKLVDVSGALAAEYYRLKLDGDDAPKHRLRRISQLEGQFRKQMEDLQRVRNL